ncbi:MAG: PDZ domain-containing protein [Candidatus Zixiibacteriota bacterium]|nr:MAG: PDZ domain-containing protein [candidate division Zixibacteria bacterium]
MSITHLGRRATLLLNTCLIILMSVAFGNGPAHSDNADADKSTPTLPGNYRIIGSGAVIEFPFDVYRGDIRFECEVNGHKVRMLLDDGCMWDQLLFWGSPLIDSLGLEYDGDTSIGGPSDADAIPSRTASNITVILPGVEFTDQTAVITSYSSGTSSMWQGSVGQVSATFFKHFVVDINFDSMLITLTEPGKFIYQGRGTEIPWKPMGFGPWSIPGSIVLSDGRSISMEFLMDLGYNRQLQLVTYSEHDITVPEPALPASLGFNIQRVETRGHVGRLASVNIGGHEIKDVLAEFVAKEHANHTFHEAMIGLGLLSRFNLVFDYYKQRLLVEPNGNFDEPFEYNMSGLVLGPGNGDYLEVREVYAGSPASEAGLKAGDRIFKVNDRQATSYDLYELRALWLEEGATIRLVVSSDGSEHEVSLTLRRVI